MGVKKKLKARDIEQLENTSIASALVGNEILDVNRLVNVDIIKTTCQQDSVCEETVECVVVITCGFTSCVNTCCHNCSVGTCFCTAACTLVSCDAGTVCACTKGDSCNDGSVCVAPTG